VNRGSGATSLSHLGARVADFAGNLGCGGVARELLSLPGMKTTTNAANIFQGSGDGDIAASLYASEVLRVAACLRREGVYVCFPRIIERMPGYNLDILNNVLWGLCIEGRL